MIRTLVLGLLAGAIPLPGQEGGDARALFDKMEAKLQAAGTLSFKCRVQMSGEGVGRGFLEGRIELESPNKAKAGFTGPLDGNNRKFELTSDGRRTKWFVSGFGDGGGPAPPKMNSNIVRWLGRADLFSALYIGLGLEWAEAGIDAAGQLKVSGLKMGEKGKVGKTAAQAVEYALVSKEADLEYSVVLWIDAEKLVPLKKEMTVEGRGKITETYSGYKIDQPIAPGRFTLPK